MFTIVERSELNPTVTKLVVKAPLIAKKAQPGQFVILRACADSERIPLTIADQDPAAGTCPNLTMLENLSLADNKGGSYGLGRGVNKKRIDFYRQQLASLGLGLEDKLDVRMGALSGGQRQAVALLMATMTPLKFLILDEHTAALDPKTAEVIMALTDRVIREKHLTAMMVTHNLRYAVEYGDRILMMNRGRVVLDRAGAEKRATSMDDILTMFNQISLETGN